MSLNNYEIITNQKEIIKKLMSENRRLKKRLSLTKYICSSCNKEKPKKDISSNGRCKECERQRAKENYRKRRLKSEQV